MLEPLQRLWRGDEPLARAFWGWAVVGSLLVNGATTTLFLILSAQDLVVLGLVAGYAISVPYNILAIVGVWRAADRHPGARFWAEAARIAALIGLIAMSVA